MTRNITKQTPEQQLQAAITRAEQNRVQVIAEGRRMDNLAPVYFVPSQSNPDLWHRVTQTGPRLSCDCFAGLNGVLCVHRATVHVLLRSRAAKRQRRAS